MLGPAVAIGTGPLQAHPHNLAHPPSMARPPCDDSKWPRPTTAPSPTRRSRETSLRSPWRCRMRPTSSADGFANGSCRGPDAHGALASASGPPPKTGLSMSTHNLTLCMVGTERGRTRLRRCLGYHTFRPELAFRQLELPKASAAPTQCPPPPPSHKVRNSSNLQGPGEFQQPDGPVRPGSKWAHWATWPHLSIPTDQGSDGLAAIHFLQYARSANITYTPD